MKFLDITHFFLLLGLLVSSSKITAADETNTINLIKVIKLQGEVQYQSPGQPWKLLKINDQLFRPITLKSLNSKSFVVLEMGDDEKVMLKNGELKIELETDKKTNLTKEIFQLITGSLFVSAKKANSNSLSKEKIFKTKNAAMGVRGTKFFITEEKDQTYLCVCEGVVNINNQSSSIDVGIKEDVWARKDEKLTKSPASPAMFDMAINGFKEMGIEVN